MAKCENCYHNEMCQALENCNGIMKIPANCCEYFRDNSLIVELPCRVGDKEASRSIKLQKRNQTVDYADALSAQKKLKQYAKYVEGEK